MMANDHDDAEESVPEFDRVVRVVVTSPFEKGAEVWENGGDAQGVVTLT